MNKFSSLINNVTGPEEDVVISSSISLARNLVDFPFPVKFNNDDGEKVRLLVFDAFSQIKNAENFRCVCVHDLEPLGQKILLEREIISSVSFTNPDSAIAIKLEGSTFCRINENDHVLLNVTVPGKNCKTAYKIAKSIDDELQQYLQFASSVNFGYLTSDFNNLGTGLKIKYKLHLPSITRSGLIEKVFKDLLAQGISIKYHHNEKKTDFALGSLYDISNEFSMEGTEEQQIQKISNIVENLIYTERKTRNELLAKMPTIMQDYVQRSYAMLKYSKIISYEEAMQSLSSLKCGVDMKLVFGVNSSQLYSLFQMIQESYLRYLLKSEELVFEDDISTEDIKVNRLRSMIIQDIISKIKLST